MKLVIDDVKTFPIEGDVLYARTLKEGFELLEANPELEELWLDHDLGNDDTIRPLVLQIAEKAFNGNPYKIEKIVICSLNVVGVTWINSTLCKFYEIELCQSSEQVQQLTGSNEKAVWY